MVFENLKNTLSDVIMDLKPAPIPDEPVEFEMVTLDRTETDSSKWLSYITEALDGAKTFFFATITMGINRLQTTITAEMTFPDELQSSGSNVISR